MVEKLLKSDRPPGLLSQFKIFCVINSFDDEGLHSIPSSVILL